MKLRTVVLGALAVGVAYAVHKHQAENGETTPNKNGSAHPKSATSREPDSTIRTVVHQLEEKGRYAPFPSNVVLTAVAKFAGRRMDR